MENTNKTNWFSISEQDRELNNQAIKETDRYKAWKKKQEDK